MFPEGAAPSFHKGRRSADHLIPWNCHSIEKHVFIQFPSGPAKVLLLHSYSIAATLRESTQRHTGTVWVKVLFKVIRDWGMVVGVGGESWRARNLRRQSLPNWLEPIWSCNMTPLICPPRQRQHFSCPWEKGPGSLTWGKETGSKIALLLAFFPLPPPTAFGFVYWVSST